MTDAVDSGCLVSFVSYSHSSNLASESRLDSADIMCDPKVWVTYFESKSKHGPKIFDDAA